MSSNTVEAFMQLRRVVEHREPRYPCVIGEGAHEPPSEGFLAHVGERMARPLLPLAMAATLASAAPGDGSSAQDSVAQACCHDADEAGARAPRKIARLTSDETERLVVDIDRAIDEIESQALSIKGEVAVPIRIPTGAEAGAVIKQLFAKNDITLTVTPVLGKYHQRATDPSSRIDIEHYEYPGIGPAQFNGIGELHEREIGKARGERASLTRGIVNASSKRVEINRLLLEMERFLEWLDRNGHPRIPQ